MDFTRADGFYAAPFPSADLQDADGHLNLSSFPDREDIPILAKAFELGEEDMDGAGVSSGVYFRLTGSIDPASLPDLHQSVEDTSTVFLMDVTPGSPDRGQRVPVTLDYRDDGGRFGTRFQLSLLPLQGAPLRPHTWYAAVILRDLPEPQGRRLSVAPAMTDLRAGRAPDGLAGAALQAYLDGLAELATAGVDLTGIAGMTVFRTADPVAQARDVLEDALSQPRPQPNAPPVLVEVFDELCTFHTTIDMPVYQRGDPPYTALGGRWAFDAQGAPVLQHWEEANLWITLPRMAPPAGGVPAAVFIRTGGGGDRPLVDRGVHDEPHGPTLEPGTGPALYFARAGYAGISVDGPHGGLRNVSGNDEQFLMFNITNPEALRDNTRQSAVELMLLAHVLETVTVDASGCPEADTGSAVGFDLTHLALMGHSMGATIAPLVLALEPRYKAVILSGAGASWIENLMYKQSPLNVRDMAELLLNYEPGELHRHDPALSILQWAADSADPLSYLRLVIQEPEGRDPVQVLMLQGIVDTYIMPPIANAMSLGLGLDLAGSPLDVNNAALEPYGFAPLFSLLPLVGSGAIGLPAEANLTVDGYGDLTAVVVQHAEDGVEDGHEVVFQTDLPKVQYQCFLKTLRAGAAYVPAAAGDPRCD